MLNYNPASGKHTVEYAQGSREQLTLARERWRQDEPETSSSEDDDDDEGEGALQMHIDSMCVHVCVYMGPSP